MTEIDALREALTLLGIPTGAIGAFFLWRAAKLLFDIERRLYRLELHLNLAKV